MDGDKAKLLDRIIKLFNLGDEARNSSEEETMAAITKARQLMAEHNISLAEVQMASGSAHAEEIRVAIEECDAYTLRGGRFATYDNGIAFAVDEICGTRNFIRKSRTFAGTFVSRRFVGDTVDVAVASKLFMILLTDMRKAARRRYGPGWSLTHTSYCDGYAHRIWERSRQELKLTAHQTQCVALVLRKKDEAINKYCKDVGVKEARPGRHQRRDYTAMMQGRADGSVVDLSRLNKLTGTG